MASRHFGDAIPDNWSCRQTYIRNHLAMHAAIGTLHANDGGPRALRVADIGGGVIEPFLLGALLLQHGYSADDCTIEIVDPSPTVCAILHSLRDRRPLRLPAMGDVPVVDPARESLDLSKLARIFSSPESPINPMLANPQLMAPSLAELIELGLAPHLGLPNDVEAGIEQLQADGFPARSELASMFMVREQSILDFVPEGASYDLVIANFSSQYPIMEGHAGEVARQFLHALAPHGVLQHASTYGAQVHLIRALLQLEPSLRAAFGIRELDVVRYDTDVEEEPLRLRVRTDLIVRRLPLLAALNRTALGIVPSDVVVSRARQELALLDLDPHDGLVRPHVTGALWMDGSSTTFAASDRDQLLAFGTPLWSRISLLS